jgi:hypothetical protein
MENLPMYVYITFGFTVLLTIWLFSRSFKNPVPAGGRFLDRLDLKSLTLVHIVAIPVELVLYWLFLNKAVPKLMTFEGRNFDILSGLSAPLVWYFGFVKQKLGRIALIIWNLVCLALLLNVIPLAVLSLPTPFQRFAFDQPNIALGHFPFFLLPACIVPLVLFSHLAALRILILRKQSYYH